MAGDKLSTGTLIRMVELWGVDLNALLVGKPSAAIVNELVALRDLKHKYRVLLGRLESHMTGLRGITRTVKNIEDEINSAQAEAKETGE